jgi:heme A synthase
MSRKSFAYFAWGMVAYNVIVILWGAVVSSTGAGAGCGDRWPDCQGQLIPQSTDVQTLTEFSHRLSSALDGLLVIGLLIWAWRKFPAGHRVRAGAIVSFVLIIVEGLLGALLVRQGWTALDTSVERVIMQPLHLANTLFLLAALALTAWWASDGPPVRLTNQGARPWLLAAGLVGMMFVSGSGAIISLGDFLDQQERVRNEALVQWLVDLRLWHPGIAIGIGVGIIVMIISNASLTPSRAARRWSVAVCLLILAQWGVGLLNVYLRVPLWTQLLHLASADLIWIAMVLWSASALSDPAQHSRPVPAQARMRVASKMTRESVTSIFPNVLRLCESRRASADDENGAGLRAQQFVEIEVEEYRDRAPGDEAERQITPAPVGAPQSPQVE